MLTRWKKSTIFLLALTFASLPRFVSSFTLSLLRSISRPALHFSTSSPNNDARTIKIIDNVANHCNVKPPTDYRSIPAIKQFARWTWRRRGSVLKILHWNDPLTPVDSCINLECLWWKALSTTDPQSPCYDTLTYDMLPRHTRWILKAFRRLHPRWIHALLEVRMAYLNQAIDQEMQRSNAQNFRIISLGAGYDIRSIRMLNQPKFKGRMECYEFDLPSTVESKAKLIQRRLFQQQERRKNSLPVLQLPTMIGVDLNDTVEFQRQLDLILSKDTTKKEWHTIFVVEGVLMYLEPTNAVATLQICAKTMSPHVSLCFADRIFQRPDCNWIPIQEQFDAIGWTLLEWAPSPNANAKHMGIAHSSTKMVE